MEFKNENIYEHLLHIRTVGCLHDNYKPIASVIVLSLLRSWFQNEMAYDLTCLLHLVFSFDLC